MVYLLHFDRPYQHAQHSYSTLLDETAVTLLNQGHAFSIYSPLIRAAADDGIKFTVARRFAGDEKRAAELRRQGGAADLCPMCRAARSEAATS